MEEVYVSFDASGHVEAEVTRWLDDGEGGQVEQPHEGMQLVTFDGDWQNVHFMRLADDGETLELDAGYKAEVEAGWAEAQQEAEAAAERRATIDAGAADFFADGGRERMQAEIDDASGGADPQLQAIARMQVMTMDLTSVTSTECVAFRDYWLEWQPDTKYEYQQPLRWKGLYYRASKALTSSEVYPPDTAGESEYYPVEVAPDGIIVYRECHGQYDMVLSGETRHYPDAEGPVYRAKVDTAYDPDTVPSNWELA